MHRYSPRYSKLYPDKGEELPEGSYVVLVSPMVRALPLHPWVTETLGAVDTAAVQETLETQAVVEILEKGERRDRLLLQGFYRAMVEGMQFGIPYGDGGLKTETEEVHNGIENVFAGKTLYGRGLLFGAGVMDAGVINLGHKFNELIGEYNALAEKANTRKAEEDIRFKELKAYFKPFLAVERIKEHENKAAFEAALGDENNETLEDPRLTRDFKTVLENHLKKQELLNLIYKYNALIARRERLAGLHPAKALPDSNQLKLKLLARKLQNVLAPAHAYGRDMNVILGAMGIHHDPYDPMLGDASALQTISEANIRNIFGINDANLTHFDLVNFTLDFSNVDPDSIDPTNVFLHEAAYDEMLTRQAKEIEDIELAAFNEAHEQYKEKFNLDAQEQMIEIDNVRTEFKAELEGLAELFNVYMNAAADDDGIDATTVDEGLKKSTFDNYTPNELYAAYNEAKNLKGKNQLNYKPNPNHEGLTDIEKEEARKDHAKVMLWHLEQRLKTAKEQLQGLRSAAVAVSADFQDYLDATEAALKEMTEVNQKFVLGTYNETLPGEKQKDYQDYPTNIAGYNAQMRDKNASFVNALGAIDQEHMARVEQVSETIKVDFEKQLEQDEPKRKAKLRYLNPRGYRETAEVVRTLHNGSVSQSFQDARKTADDKVKKEYAADKEKVRQRTKDRYHYREPLVKEKAEALEKHMDDPVRLIERAMAGNVDLQGYPVPEEVVDAVYNMVYNVAYDSENAGEDEQRNLKNLQAALLEYAKLSQDQKTEEGLADIFIEKGIVPANDPDGYVQAAIVAHQAWKTAKAAYKQALIIGDQTEIAGLRTELANLERQAQTDKEDAMNFYRDVLTIPELQNSRGQTKPYSLDLHTLSYLLYDPESIDDDLVLAVADAARREDLDVVRQELYRHLRSGGARAFRGSDIYDHIKTAVDAAVADHGEKIKILLQWGKDRRAIANQVAERNVADREIKSQDSGAVTITKDDTDDPLLAVKKNITKPLKTGDTFTSGHSRRIPFLSKNTLSTATYTSTRTKDGVVQSLSIPVVKKEKDAELWARVVNLVTAFVDRGGLRNESLDLQGLFHANADTKKLAVTVYAFMQVKYPRIEVKGIYASDVSGNKHFNQSKLNYEVSDGKRNLKGTVETAFKKAKILDKDLDEESAMEALRGLRM